MKTTRFSHSFSRFLLPAVVFASVGIAACSADRGQAPESEAAPAEQAQAAPVEAPQAAPADPGEAAADKDRGGRMDSARALPWLRQVEKLDLRPEQRTALEAISSDLRLDLQPSRNEMKKLVDVYVAGVEAGKIDRQAVEAQRAVLASTAPIVKEALENAANGVHDALDEAQRAELVAMMRARRSDGHAYAENKGHCDMEEQANDSERAEKRELADGKEGGRRHGRRPLAKLADELGLSQDQQRTIQEAVQKGIDNLFPLRAEKREEMIARLTAMEDAFLTDDFDASDFDIGKDMQEMLKGAGDGATVLADLAVRVLTENQRATIAQKIRERTAKL